MPKGYIYENGELVEELDFSTDAGIKDRYCVKCRKVTAHTFTAVSIFHRQVWTCYACGHEES